MFVPAVMLLLQVLERQERPAGKVKYLLALGIWAGVTLVFFAGFSGQTVDQTMLFYWQLIAEDGQHFAGTKVRGLSVLIIVVVALLLMIFEKNRKVFEKIMVIGLTIMCLGNNALSVYVQYKTHTHSRQETREAEEILSFVREHSQDNVLVLEPAGNNELLDTFLMDCHNVRTGIEPVVTQVEEKYQMPKDVTYVLACDQAYTLDENMLSQQSYPRLGYTLFQLRDKQDASDIVIKSAE